MRGVASRGEAKERNAQRGDSAGVGRAERDTGKEHSVGERLVRPGCEADNTGEMAREC